MYEPLSITRRKAQIGDGRVPWCFRINGERDSAADLLVRACPAESRSTCHWFARQDFDVFDASVSGTGPNGQDGENQLADKPDGCRTIIHERSSIDMGLHTWHI